MSTLRDEIKQTKPFRSPEQEASLNIGRTAAVLDHGLTDALKVYGVTGTQYNVLRILRGAGSEGLCRYEIAERMINQVPDVTRLLDRLEEAGLVTRKRDVQDRRQVQTRITEKGLDLLSRLDQPIDELHRKQLGHLTPEQLNILTELLTLARNPR
jgi:DNA-binding MarR family transcriptional regulator